MTDASCPAVRIVRRDASTSAIRARECPSVRRAARARCIRRARDADDAARAIRRAARRDRRGAERRACGAIASSCCRRRPTTRSSRIPRATRRCSRATRIADWAGVEHLLIKHEGHNPTGSFKDRGMTVAMTQARRTGARAVACASTGNTSASLAAYAAHAGLPALVFVPAGQGRARASSRRRSRTARRRCSCAATSTTVSRSRARRAAALGIQLLNSINPFRLEGQKTIVFELLEQLEWNAPDWIALPAGNLGNTSAFGKALREAHAIGLIDRDAAHRGDSGERRGAVRGELSRRLSRATVRGARDGRDGDSHRRAGVVGSRGARDPRDERRRASMSPTPRFSRPSG